MRIILGKLILFLNWVFTPRSFLKVPCLRIREDEGGVQWMYESNDIINYLAARFPAPAQS